MVPNSLAMIYFTLLMCLGFAFARYKPEIDPAFNPNFYDHPWNQRPTSRPTPEKLRVFREWKFVDFVWLDSYQRNKIIQSGNYSIKDCVPYDVDQAPDSRIFVTIPRTSGVPATLSVVSEQNGEGGPLLRPYPDWDWNQRDDCGGIIGVYRVAIVNNYLFVLDTGKNGENQVCPAQLLVFDLRADQLVHRVVIPSEIATGKNGKGLLVTPIVNLVGPDISNINVYMADTEGYGLVLWDGANLTRFESQFFEPEKNATTFTVANDSFDIDDGILGMALTVDELNTFERQLYFRPLASYHMNYVNPLQLSVMKNSQSEVHYMQESLQFESQSAAMAFSWTGVLFFSSLSDTALLCWNRHKPFTTKNIVAFAVDSEALQFPSGVKIVRYDDGDELLVMTNRYQQVANGNMNFNDTNFRILSGKVENLIAETPCAW